MHHLKRRAVVTTAAVAALALGSALVLVLAAPAAADDLEYGPTLTISGDATAMANTDDLAVASDGTVWVANSNATNTVGSILAFAPGSTGNAAPEADITGSNTTLQWPAGIALDSSGNVWVADYSANAIDEFSASANGNVGPANSISGPATGLNIPTGLAVGADGTIYVANGDDQILEFANGASGNVAPENIILGTNTGLGTGGVWGIKLQADGSIVVCGDSDTIETFAANASGDATPKYVIAGSNTDLGTEGEVAVDPSGNIYSTDSNTSTVTEYPADANGNVAPASRLIGGNTGLISVSSVATDASGNLWLVDFGNDAPNTSFVDEFKPLLSSDVVAPASGSEAGGVSVTLHGSGFVAGATVTFGGVPATDVVVVNSTTITAVAPAHAVGSVDIVVNSAIGCGCSRGTATMDDAFTYDPALATTGVDPTPGIAAGILLFGLGGVLLLIRRRLRVQ